MAYLRLIVVLVLVSAAARAETGGHPVTMWEIQGVHNKLFLLGSIHMLRDEDYPLPDVINAAYDEAEVLIMEIDMDDLDPVATQSAFFEHGVLHDDTTLQDLMGDSMYKQVLEAATKIDVPMEMLAKTEPWYAAITVELLALNRMGFDPLKGVEMHLMSKAGADGKSIEGLETIVEQVGFLDGIPLPAQRAMLLATLQQGADLENAMDDLIVAWRHGDIEVLETELLDDFAEHKELEEILLTRRNNRWIEQIRERLDDDDDYLIVVGALHLVGEAGVPRQLDRLGIPIRQLSEPPSIR